MSSPQRGGEAPSRQYADGYSNANAQVDTLVSNPTWAGVAHVSKSTSNKSKTYSASRNGQRGVDNPFLPGSQQTDSHGDLKYLPKTSEKVLVHDDSVRTKDPGQQKSSNQPSTERVVEMKNDRADLRFGTLMLDKIEMGVGDERETEQLYPVSPPFSARVCSFFWRGHMKG